MKITLKEIAFSACIAFLILISPLFIYHKITHMNKDDLAWLNIYKGRDTVLFRCNQFATDTLMMYEKYIMNSLSPFNFGFFETSDDEYIAHGIIHMILMHQGQELYGYFYIFKEENRSPVRHNILFGDRYLEYYHERLRIVRIGQKVYDDCIIVDDSNSEFGYVEKETEKRIKKFVWSKSEGLLWYNCNDSIYIKVANKQ